jgi:hypothetical protein
MKYTRNTNNQNTKQYVPINEIPPISSLNSQDSLIIYSGKEGTGLITIEDLIALLDIRYAKKENYDPNELLEAVEKIFNNSSKYDPSYANVNREYIDNKLEDIKDEHTSEIIDAIEQLFSPKK